jgi:hypothetical protein
VPRVGASVTVYGFDGLRLLIRPTAKLDDSPTHLGGGSWSTRRAKVSCRGRVVPIPSVLRTYQRAHRDLVQEQPGLAFGPSATKPFADTLYAPAPSDCGEMRAWL